MKKKKHSRIWAVVGIILLGIVAVGSTYSHFGGFGTGPCADETEFMQYRRQGVARIDGLGCGKCWHVCSRNEVQGFGTSARNALGNEWTGCLKAVVACGKVS